MPYETDPIVILNEAGEIAASKPRQQIDRRRDFLYTIHVFVFTNKQELALSTILQQPQLPKLFHGKLGSTVATLLQEGESRDQAAKRTVKEEILIDAQPEFLGEEIDEIDGEIRRKQAVYQLNVDTDILAFNPQKLDGLTYRKREELEKQIQQKPEQFAPTFLLLYERYKDQWKF